MATVQIKYSTLLNVSIRQLFYDNQICRKYQSVPVLDFNIVPTDETLILMQQKSMVFKNVDSRGGFVVMARTLGKNAGGNDLLKYPVNNTQKLTFMVTLQNPDSVNFDLLPTQQSSGLIYYFSNQVTDAAALRTDLHLSKAAAGVDGATDTIKKSSANYTFHSASVVAPADVQVKHLLTGAVAGPSSVNVNGGQSDINVNLSSFPSGRCQLFIGGVQKDDFYFLGSMANQLVFAVIELSLSSALPANYRIVESDQSLTAQRPNYSVQFKNRPTTWRYTIQLQPNSPLFLEMAKLTAPQKTAFINQLAISTNDGAVAFKLASNTDTSFVFVSKTLITLRESYVSSTSLTKDPLILSLQKYSTTPAKEAVVKTNLPYPSTDMLDAGSLPAIYSDIFLTL